MSPQSRKGLEDADWTKLGVTLGQSNSLLNPMYPKSLRVREPRIRVVSARTRRPGREYYVAMRTTPHTTGAGFKNEYFVERRLSSLPKDLRGQAAKVEAKSRQQAFKVWKLKNVPVWMRMR